MINDVFFNRYKQQIYYRDELTPQIQAFFTQIVIIFEELDNKCAIGDQIFKNSEFKLAKELGGLKLTELTKPKDSCFKFLMERHDIWNDAHGTADTYIKLRLSLIEIIFRELEESIKTEVDAKVAKLLNWGNIKGSQSPEYKELIRYAIEELNQRFLHARLSMHYHNGYIQFIDNDLASNEVEKDFWTLLKDSKWRNVDIDIKEAIHKRDNQERDAAFYAFKALESTIKILSNDLGFSTGKEKGAANYIDNLVSQKNGKFIDVWESEILKSLFAKIRNPHGHGPGNDEMISLNSHQQVWVIENVLSWIKSLIRRSA